MASFVAGGVAGQAHFVMSHYLRQWKTSPRKSPVVFKPPKVRATMGAFLPTALSFLAFQYGGELAERWINNDVQAFPVYIWARR